MKSILFSVIKGGATPCGALTHFKRPRISWLHGRLRAAQAEVSAHREEGSWPRFASRILRFTPSRIPALLITALLAALASELSTATAQTAIPDAERPRIENAIAQLTAVPAKRPRKVLVFSRAWGYKHTSIPYGDNAFKLLGKKTGAFEAVVTYEDALFEREKLFEFDAVVFNNTNNEIFLPENFADLSKDDQARALQKDARLKKSFRDYIAQGGGLAVIHAGIASFREWPEFGEIMGARFDNHPWVAGSTVTLRVEEPNHPVAKAFGGEYFQITDEIYQFKGNYSRDRLRILLSIDTEKTDMNKGAAIHRADEDFGMSWVKHYGRGRVFYCALGHQHDIFWNRSVLQHFLSGLQFAIGDLEADATPSNRIRK